MAKAKRVTSGKSRVGYGKPPRHTQFKRGQSGNPKGRPKGSKSLSRILMDAVKEQVTIKENGIPKKTSKLIAMLKQLANKGATGDLKALQIIWQRIEDLESSAEDASGEDQLEEVDRQVMRGLQERIRKFSNAEEP